MKNFKKIVFSFILVLSLSININAEDIDNWNGLGGNETNNKITNTKTATSNEDMETKFVISGKLKDPIIYENKIYAIKDKTLVEYSMDGKELRSTTLFSSVGFFSKIGYGDGKIYVALSNRIQAFDINTFESLWLSKAESGYQMISSILYNDGYIYSGITSGGTGTVSNGKFFALKVSDDDQDNKLEEKAYTWTYEQETSNGHYWSDAAVVNGAIVFAGDSGMLVSHHPSKKIIFDKIQLGNKQEANKVRSAIVYNKAKNKLIVATQDSHTIYVLEVKSVKFDRSTIKSTNLVGEVSGGIASSNDYLYVPSGGMYGKGFTILNYNLDILYTTTDYGTQSFPLVTSAYATTTNNNKVYIYFMEYSSGKLIRLEHDDNINQSNVKATEYKDNDLSTYNSSSLITNSNGDLIILSSGFLEGKIISYKNKNSEYTKQDIENLINNLNEDVSLYDRETIQSTNKRVEQYLANQVNDLSNIDKYQQVNNKYDTLVLNEIKDIELKLNNFEDKINGSQINDFYKVYAQASNLELKDRLKISNYDKINNLMNSFDINSSAYIYEEISSYDIESISVDDYENLKNINQRYLLLSQNDQLHVSNYQTLVNLLDKAHLLTSQELVKGIISDTQTISSPVTLKQENLIIKLNTDINALHKSVSETLDVKIIDTIKQAYVKVVEIRKTINEIDDTLWSITPGKVSLKDESKLKKSYDNYNKLSAYDKTLVKNWSDYASLKAEFDKIKINIVKIKDVTYTYKKISNIWYLSKLDLNNDSKRNIITYVYNKNKCVTNSKSIYNCSLKVSDYREAKKNKKVVKRQLIKYNTNALVYENTIQTKNKYGKFITNARNVRTYYSNKKMKSNTLTLRNLNNGKYTKITQTKYYSNGKKSSYIVKTFKNGVLNKTTVYKYNTKGKRI